MRGFRAAQDIDRRAFVSQDAREVIHGQPSGQHDWDRAVPPDAPVERSVQRRALCVRCGGDARVEQEQIRARLRIARGHILGRCEARRVRRAVRAHGERLDDADAKRVQPRYKVARLLRRFAVMELHEAGPQGLRAP